MKQILLLIIIILAALSSCKKEETIDEVIEQEIELTSQDFSFTTSANSIEIYILQSDSDQISWYDLYIGKPGEEIELDVTSQDLYNDTLTSKFDNLESNTTYIVKVEGRSHAFGGEVYSSGSKDITTDQ